MPGVGTGNGDGSSAIDEALDDLELASVAFNSPRTMRLNEPVVIQLLLSGGRTIDELQEELDAIGEEEGEQSESPARWQPSSRASASRSRR